MQISIIILLIPNQARFWNVAPCLVHGANLICKRVRVLSIWIRNQESPDSEWCLKWKSYGFGLSVTCFYLIHSLALLFQHNARFFFLTIMLKLCRHNLDNPNLKSRYQHRNSRLPYAGSNVFLSFPLTLGSWLHSANPVRLMIQTKLLNLLAVKGDI